MNGNHSLASSDSESDEIESPLLKTPCNNTMSNKRVGLSTTNETKSKQKNAASKRIEEREQEDLRKKNGMKERKKR